MPRGTSWGSSWPQAPDREKPGRQTPSFLSPSPGHKPEDPSSWPPRRPSPALNSPPAAVAGLQLKQKHPRVIHAARPGEGHRVLPRGRWRCSRNTPRSLSGQVRPACGAPSRGGRGPRPGNHCHSLAPGVGGGPTLCHVSWTTPAFSDRISMSRWASPSLNTMLPTVETSVL